MKNQQQKVGRGYGTRKASDTGIRDKKLGTAGRIDAEGGEEERKRGPESATRVKREERCDDRGRARERVLLQVLSIKQKTKVRVGNAQLPALWYCRGNDTTGMGSSSYKSLSARCSETPH